MEDRESQSAGTLTEPPPEIDTALLSSVAKQLLHRRRVRIKGDSLPVGLTSRQYFRKLIFPMNGRRYMAIEQNAAKPSYWAKLAREGHEVVQFRELRTGRYVAVAVDGRIRGYPASGG